MVNDNQYYAPLLPWHHVPPPIIGPSKRETYEGLEHYRDVKENELLALIPEELREIAKEKIEGLLDAQREITDYWRSIDY